MSSFQIRISHFLFIRGLSCPSCIQASLSLNCIQLSIPGYPQNCLPVSCGDIVYRTSGVIFFIDYCTAIRDT
jgi:hypothetical protein